jgi:hypothetical protein
MNRIVKVLAIATAFAVVLSLPSSVRAQNASKMRLQSKCAACFRADGSAMGKELGAHDFQTAEVQKMSDADLSDIVTKSKNKRPAYGEFLQAKDGKGLVAFIRTLRK